MISINLNLLENLSSSEAEKLFNLDFKKEDWIWINQEIFADLMLNVIDYEEEEEEVILQKINEIQEDEFITIIKGKLKEMNWVEVNQLLFEKLENGFKATEDIKTYIFAERRFFMLKMINKMKEFQWMLRAMAIDTFQHLTPERKLPQVHEEDFQDNFMILEELLVKGMYSRNNCTWKVVPVTNALIFYKNSKEYRAWAEGNANFIFTELSK